MRFDTEGVVDGALARNDILAYNGTLSLAPISVGAKYQIAGLSDFTTSTHPPTAPAYREWWFVAVRRRLDNTGFDVYMSKFGDPVVKYSHEQDISAVDNFITGIGNGVSNLYAPYGKMGPTVYYSNQELSDAGA